MSFQTFTATTGHGLARATRGANDVWSVEAVAADQDVRCLAGDPLHPDVVYAGTQGNGVLRSDDGGRTWRQAGLAGRVVKSLAVSRAQPGAVYAGTKPALVFVSRDGGRSWMELMAFRRIPARRLWLSPAELPFTAYAQALALSPTNAQVILVGIEAGAVVRSGDGGQTWSGHRQGAIRDCHSLIFHTTSGEWAYEGGGTGAGAACSRDGGQTWTQPQVGLDRHYGWAVAADPARPDVWYVSVAPGPGKAHGERGAEAYIFRMTENGSWHKLAGGLPQPLDHMPYALLTDPAEPGALYAGLSDGNVWQSEDQGETWRRLPFNLGSIHRTLLAL